MEFEELKKLSGIISESEQLDEGMKEIKWADIDNATQQDIQWIGKNTGLGQARRYFTQGKDKISIMYDGHPLFFAGLKKLIQAKPFTVSATSNGELSITISKSKSKPGKASGDVPDAFTK